MTVPTQQDGHPHAAHVADAKRDRMSPGLLGWEQSGPVLQGRILAAVAAVALVLGVWALTQVDPQQIGGTGLIQVLPPAYFVALGLSLVGFVGSLGLRRLFPALLTAQVVVLIVILQAADPIIHGVPRLEASFRHLGIADYIAGSGQLNPHLDAYFSWPGFFGLLGMLSDATGVHNLTAVATWAPLAINILLLPALLAIAVRLTTNRRHAWAAVWAFYLTSWVGQDYLSPQAYALILLFTLLACVLTAFDGWAWLPGGNRFTATLRKVVHRLDGTEPRPGLSAPAADTVSLLVVCAVLLLAMTASHQLTPFVTIPILVGLLLIGRLRLRFLPVLALVLPACWLVLVATPYVAGHMSQVFGSFGDLTATTSASISSRLTGSADHEFIVYARMAEAALVWALALAGAIVGHRRRTPWLAAAVGALAPFVLLPAQPYGGELLLRIYLFGLPFMAFLAVLPLIPTTAEGFPWRRSGALLLVGAVLATATVTSRYGNDEMENFSPDEVALANHLYDVAPAKSMVIEGVHNTAWRFQDYAGYDYRTLVGIQTPATAAPVSCDAVNQLAKRAGAYLVITQSQEASAELLQTGPSGNLAHLVQSCSSSPGWSTVFHNSGGVILHVQGANNVK
ncbi:MAG TPA: hypothetical protein VGN49_06580 [Micrococcaceae bacterium]|nr:hypothetical protein [Micrococcaceae bacterium]